jgi:CDP-diacylglycerol--glycerol-3-phosphate 3-phosphatidyltransferase
MKRAIGETRELLQETDQRKARRQEIMEKSRIFTLANFISLLRLLLLPFVVACLLENDPTLDWIALALVLIAASTDYFDGVIARRRDEISQLGKIIDPVADKLFIGALGLILVFLRGLPAWFVALLLLRDFLILTISYVLFLNRDIVMASNQLGKITTAVLLATLVAYTIRLEEVGLPLVYLGAALVLGSGIVYARKFIKVLRSIQT